MMNQGAVADKTAAKRLAIGTLIDIKGVDVLDAIVVEGVLAEVEKATREQADRAMDSGDAESAALIEVRVRRFGRFRAAMEAAVYTK